MNYIIDYNKFLLIKESNTQEKIKELIPGIFDIAKKYNAYDVSYNYKIILVNEYTDDEKFVDKITFTIIIETDSDLYNQELKDEIDTYGEVNNKIDKIRVEFQQGSKKNTPILAKYICNIFLDATYLTSEENIKTSKDLKKERLFRTLGKGGVLDFIKKYNINNFEEFLDICTLSTRDINKYAKITTDKDFKKQSYNIKDWVLKMLLRCDYIESIKKHEINGQLYALLYTKAKHEKLKDGRVSFHIPPFRIHKYDNYFNTMLDSYEEETRDYSPSDTPILDEVRMKDFYEIVSSRFPSRDLIFDLKNYFKNHHLN